MNNFYVYEHRDFKGVPFYVGKGKDDRSLHVRRNKWWLNKVRKLRGFITAKIFVGLSEQDAFKKEIDLITKYRSQGIELVNLTNGGEGLSGHIFSKEHRLKIGLANKRRPHRSLSKEHKLKISIAGKGRKLSAETKARMSAAQKGRIITDAHKLKFSGSKHGRAKLTDMQAVFIRGSNMAGVELAKKFNISTAQVSRIRNGKKWKHL